jgi:putative transcriptional regulator
MVDCQGGYHPSPDVKNRLPLLRAEHGWTQADLANRLDVSRQTVVSIEKGKYDPSLPLAFKIAQLFDLRIEEVFEPNGEREAEAS